MSHSPEQSRKKAEALAESERHMKHAAVDEMKNDSMNGNSFEDYFRSIEGDTKATQRIDEYKKNNKPVPSHKFGL